MQPSQIDYYNSLSAENHLILQTAALRCSFSVDNTFSRQINNFFRINLLIKKITAIIDDAVNEKIFYDNKDWKKSYNTSIEFLVFILPTIHKTLITWGKSNFGESIYSTSINPFALFRNCLFALLYQPEKYAGTEERFLDYSTNSDMNFFMTLIADKRYNNCLCMISKKIIYHVAFQLTTNVLNNLEPLSELNVQLQQIASLTNFPDLADKCHLRLNELFWKGKIEEGIAYKKDNTDFLAIKCLIEGNIDESVTLFRKFIKEQPTNGSKSPLPFNAHIAYFYIIALLLSNTSISMPVFQKILQLALKDADKPFFNFYTAIACDALNEHKDKLSDYKRIIKKVITTYEISSDLLTLILIYYLIGEKLEDGNALKIYNIVKKAADADYLIIGYEVAYVAKIWYNNKKFNDLYNEISHKMNYQPVISRIQRKQEWEKSLNLLLGIKSKTSARNNDSAESNARVVYFFNPKNKNLQPVVQSRTAKGWSKGRNIAMKTFMSLDVKGVSEQDIRISKHIKFYDAYYNSFYEFDKNVFIDLIGHPYVFLENTSDIPVEFVAAQVIVSIKKVSKGYQLITSLKNADEPVFIEKETNTRYKVFNLTSNQTRIIRIINEKDLMVPESGKAKLTELLGSLSAEGMAVHSDFAASDTYSHIETY